MKLSIIVVNWNVRELLAECIHSVERYVDLHPNQYELVVVDNASHDGSCEMIRERFPQVVLLSSSENLGFGRACNLAYSHCCGEFILLLNPDAKLCEGVVPHMLTTLTSRPKVGIIGCRMVDEAGRFRRDSGGYFPNLYNLAWNFLFLNKALPAALQSRPLYWERDQRDIVQADWVSGADMMIRREAVGESLFDERFYLYGEDMDICHRVANEGWQVVYSGERTLVHHQGRSFAKQQNIEVLLQAHKGPRLFFRKHHSAAATMAFDLILMVAFLIRWPMYRLAFLVFQKTDYNERALFSRRYIQALLADIVRIGKERW